jgi:hypothetical protein
MHTDIMFVGGIVFLISVTTPLGLTVCSELGRTKGARAIPSVSAALFKQLDLYSSRKFKLLALKTDPESSIIALTQELNSRGIVVNPVGTGSHVPVIECKIQEVKERCRAIYNALPYRLAFSHLAYLVLFAVQRINLTPHRAGFANLSPMEAFGGRKISVKRDLRVGFGEY